jgi:hypothetical protein
VSDYDAYDTSDAGYDPGYESYDATGGDITSDVMDAWPDGGSGDGYDVSADIIDNYPEG